MSVSDLAIVAALIFAWGTVSAWLERFDSAALPELPMRRLIRGAPGARRRAGTAPASG